MKRRAGHVRIVLEGDGAFPEIAEAEKSGNLRLGILTGIATLPGGMDSGLPSVSLVGETDDGQVLILQTSLRLLQTATAGFTGRYGDVTGNPNLGVDENGIPMVGWEGQNEDPDSEGN